MPITKDSPPPIDAGSGVGSLRTLGTGAQQAAPGNDSRFGNPTNAQVTPAANKIPLTGGSQYINGDWLKNLNPNEMYVSPTGNDSSSGTSWFSAKKYLKTAWDALVALGGGTIYVADGTSTAANGQGLHISANAVVGGTFSGVAPIRVIGVGKSFGILSEAPQAVISGGATLNGVRGDPGLWIHSTENQPMRFENLAFVTDCPVRIGWAYQAYTANGGVPYFQNITSASRAAGSTTFTLSVVALNATIANRVTGVVTMTLSLPGGLAGIPFTRYGKVTIASSSGSFNSGTFDVIANINNTQIQYMDGSFVNIGNTSVTGTTASSHGMGPGDYIEVHSADVEWPSVAYKVSAVTPTTVTVLDPYGQASPRHLTIGPNANPGTWAAQNRQDRGVAFLELENITGYLIAFGGNEDQALVYNGIGGLTNAFAPGPAFDIGGGVFYTHYKRLFGTGYNVAGATINNVCLDVERQAFINVDPGSGDGGITKIKGVNCTIGGVRHHCSGTAGWIFDFQDFIAEGGGGQGGVNDVATVVIIGANQFGHGYLNYIDTADSTIGAVVIPSNGGGPNAIVVQNASGVTGGPCINIGPKTGVVVSSFNSQGQSGWEGALGLISGAHNSAARKWGVYQLPTTARNFAVPDFSWILNGGVTLTSGVLAPDGTLTASRLQNPGSVGVAFLMGTNYQLVTQVGAGPATGDYWIGCMWVRGNAGFGLQTGGPLGTFGITDFNGIPIEQTTIPINIVGDGEWQLARFILPITNWPGGGTPPYLARWNIQLNTGFGVDIWQPTLFYIPAANVLSKNDAFEIYTHQQPQPFGGQLTANHPIAQTGYDVGLLSEDYHLYVPHPSAPTNNTLKALGGESSSVYHNVTPAFPISLTGTGVYAFPIIPAKAGRYFIPTSIKIRTKTLTGAITGAPIIRLGNNGSHDNVAPLYTVNISTALNDVETITLVSPLKAIDIGTTGISLEVQTASTGASAWQIDVFVEGTIYFP